MNLDNDRDFKDKLVKFFATTLQGSWNRSAVVARIQKMWTEHERERALHVSEEDTLS